MSKSRVRINLGTKTDDKPTSRVRINLRDESPKSAEEKEPASRVRINLEGKKG
ncbi:MAG: hypothetical protein HOY79_05990 [Streptomyces sp.]|nr:hypothetical protein [Streptomyces sp.]